LRPWKPSPILPGYRLDRYEFLCPIAEGGMASVWVARLQGKHGFEKLVAIKTILPKLSGDEMFQQMFLDEARISAGIQHLNVAQILDLGDDRGIIYLVMEWVDGDSLSKLEHAVLRKGQSIPFGISMRVLADACGGLHAAHELRGKDGVPLGVVHRDVSPQNILIAANGTAKVIDFGIAKARDRLAGETSAGLLKGKVQYMAPEQALGRPTDRRADVWAIGAILYHFVSGRPPFNGPNQLATLHLLTAGRPPPIQQVIAKALAHDPDRRYETAAELQRALEQTLVETGLTTSITDVAAFSAEHLAGRAKARREAVELALSAAAERARVEDLLQPTANDTRSGRISAKVLLTQALGAIASAAEPAPPSPISENSSATIGPAGTMISSVGKSFAGGGNKRWGFAAAATAIAIAFGVGFSSIGHLSGAPAASAGASLTAPAASTIFAGHAAPPRGPTQDDDRAAAQSTASAPAASTALQVPLPSAVSAVAAAPAEAPSTPAPPAGHAQKATDSGARAHPRGPTPTVRPAADPPSPPSSDKAPKNRHLEYGF
jgi:eukaryotic-like serine/threonine-protein kinase